MRRKDSLVAIGHPLDQHTDQPAEFLGHRIADRIGQVDACSTRLDRRLDTAAEKIMLRARAVFRRPVNVVGKITRVADTVDNLLINLVRFHLQFKFHVQGAGRDKGVNPRAYRRLQCFGRTFDISLRRPGEAADGRLLNQLGDLVDSFEIAVRRYGKTGLDYIDAHFFEHFCDPQLFVEIHGRAGRLFAVTQGGIEDNYAV